MSHESLTKSIQDAKNAYCESIATARRGESQCHAG